MKRMTAALRRRRNDESGVEAVAMMIVLPSMFVLLMALISVGLMIRTRMAIESEMRDTIRRVAADGGDYYTRTNGIGMTWSQKAMNDLYKNGKCTQSGCTQPPQIACNWVQPQNGGSFVQTNVAAKSGDLVQCRITYYYKTVNKGLLSGPLGLGTGALIKTPFTFTVTARAETGLTG